MTTEAWKIVQYQELAFEVRWIQQVEVVVVPLVIGALGTVSKDCQVAGVPRYTRDSRRYRFSREISRGIPSSGNEFVLMLVLHFAKSRDVTSLLKWVYITRCA